jgi:hypothetical protein
LSLVRWKKKRFSSFGSPRGGIGCVAVDSESDGKVVEVTVKFSLVKTVAIMTGGTSSTEEPLDSETED